MAVSIFARIGTIKGESQDAKHKDEIDVLSWSWGVSQSGIGCIRFPPRKTSHRDNLSSLPR